MKQSELNKLLKDANALFTAFPFVTSAFEQCPDEALIDPQAIECLCGAEFDVAINKIIECPNKCGSWYVRKGNQQVYYAVEQDANEADS